MSVVFRAAEVQDAAAIREVGIATWWATYTALIPPKAITAVLRQSWHQKAIETQIKSERYWVLVAQAADELVGALFAASQVGCSGSVVIERLYVRPDFQGQAVGYGLWRALVERLPPAAQTVELDVLVNNTRALAFYERLGFVEIQRFVDSLSGVSLSLVRMSVSSPFP